MTEHDDPVDAVVLAFLDYLEGTAPRPALDHLPPADRRRAESLLDGLLTARGLDPHASRPSVGALLAGTPLAGLLPAAGGADLRTIQEILAGVDGRAWVDVDADRAPAPTVSYSYLDLRARFLLVPTSSPVVTGDVRTLVQAIFAADPDTSKVGVVAAHGADLPTQLLASADVGHTITTPRGAPHTRWEPPLPLALAARRLLEQSAPEWPSFDFDQAGGEPLDLVSLAAEIAGRIIGRESARPYRGDKRRAYQVLAGHERAFAELVARISDPGTAVDLDHEVARLVQVAA